MDINQFNTVTVSPGGSVYIPKDALIISKTSTGNANIESDCLDLTSIQAFSCFKLYYELAPDRTPSIPVENQDTTITGFTIMGTTYDLPGYSADSINGFQQWIVDNGLSAIFQFNNFATTSPANDRYGKSIYFKTTPDIASTILLELTSATINILYIKPIASEDCL